MFCLIFSFPFYFSFFYIVNFLISDIDSIVIYDVFSRGREIGFSKVLYAALGGPLSLQ